MAFATQWHGTRHHWAPVVSRFKNVALDLEDGRFAGEDLVGAEVDSLGQGVQADLVDYA